MKINFIPLIIGLLILGGLVWLVIWLNKRVLEENKRISDGWDEHCQGLLNNPEIVKAVKLLCDNMIDRDYAYRYLLYNARQKGIGE